MFVSLTAKTKGGPERNVGALAGAHVLFRASFKARLSPWIVNGATKGVVAAERLDRIYGLLYIRLVRFSCATSLKCDQERGDVRADLLSLGLELAADVGFGFSAKRERYLFISASVGKRVTLGETSNGSTKIGRFI